MSFRRRLAVVALGAYVLGSFPSADLAARLAARGDGRRRRDLRAHGTGNPGALNAAHLLGARWGTAVLAADALKGAVAAALGRGLAGDPGAYAAGTGAVLGHCLPPWSRFRGGKGIATSAGSAAICFPAYMPVDIAVAASALVLSRGSADRAAYISSGLFVAAATTWWRTRRSNLWGPAPTAALPIYAVVTSGVICWRFATAARRPLVDAAPATASGAAVHP